MTAPFKYTPPDKRVLAVSERDLHAYLGELLGRRFMEYRRLWDKATAGEILSDFPLYLLVEQRFKCNLRCPMCLLGDPDNVRYRPKVPMMSDELFDKVIAEGSEHNCPSLCLNSTEEPLLNPKILERIRRAKDAGFIDTMMNTNGTHLDEEMAVGIVESGLVRLLIGIDGFSRQTYESIRVGASYDDVVGNIERFLRIREKMGKSLPVVRLSFVVNDINQHEMTDFLRYWSARVDYIAFQTYRAPPNSRTGMGAPPGDVGSDCNQPRTRLVVRADGTVLPCCSFWGYEIPVGNINENSLHAIWHAAEMKRIRESFATKCAEEVCRKCLDASPVPFPDLMKADAGIIDPA